MRVQENVPLATCTTLKVGGKARYMVACVSEEDVREAVAFAQERGLPWRPLGQGSNVLASDNGYQGVILLMSIPGIVATDKDDTVLLSVGAGVSWDLFVHEAAERNLWGIENLAGIPGTVGAAPVQNIGAYGTEVKDTLQEVRVFDTGNGEVRTLTNEECMFGYRDSRFKREPELIILSVSFMLSKVGVPSLGYKDLTSAVERGEDLNTPMAIGAAVRRIRAQKFPSLVEYGTAGSFFKNPTISPGQYAELRERYTDLPGFPNEQGIKIPLAFILDRVLGLRGHRNEHVWLFNHQPLVLVADNGATARSIDAFANTISARVLDATGIVIEREVQKFP